MLNLGMMMQGAGLGVNFGSALGTLMGGGRTKKAIAATMAAGRADAAAMLQSAEAKAQQYQQNAFLAAYDATLVSEQAHDEAQRLRRQGRRASGTLLATAAAQGAQIDAPVLDIYEEQLTEIEQAATSQIYAGELQKKSLRQQSLDFLISAEATRKTGASEADKILNQAALDAYQLKLRRRNEVVGALGTMVQSGVRGFAFFKGMGQPKGTTTISPMPPSVGEFSYTKGYEYETVYDTTDEFNVR